MKQLFTILAMTAAIFTVVFSVLPFSNLAIFPAIASIFFTSMAYYLSKKTGEVKKIIPFIFFLTIMSLALTAYKALFTTGEVANEQVLKEKEAVSKEKAIEELEELDLDDINLD
jgi:hypothetical protein